MVANACYVISGFLFDWLEFRISLRLSTESSFNGLVILFLRIGE